VTNRLPVAKTYKLYVDGKFPRSESGRTYEVEGANVARASRKDLRDAVRAARKALPGWASLTAYNRGQVLYRAAEMLEGRRAEFTELVGEPPSAYRARDHGELVGVPSCQTMVASRPRKDRRPGAEASSFGEATVATPS